MGMNSPQQNLSTKPRSGTTSVTVTKSLYLITSHGEVTNTVSATSPEIALREHIKGVIGDIEDICNKSPEEWLEDTEGYNIYKIATDGAGRAKKWDQSDLEDHI